MLASRQNLLRSLSAQLRVAQVSGELCWLVSNHAFLGPFLLAACALWCTATGRRKLLSILKPALPSLGHAEPGLAVKHLQRRCDCQ